MNLEELLGIDPANPLDRRAQLLVENDEQLLADLKGIKESKRLTQAVIAERMGISQSAVARIESGDRDPRLSTLRRYAMAVGAVVDHVVEDDEVDLVTTASAVVGQQADFVWPDPEAFFDLAEEAKSDLISHG